MIVESLGNILGLGVGEEDEEGSVSLQEIIPARRINPIRYFMPKKYSFSCRQPKRTQGEVINDESRSRTKQKSCPKTALKKKFKTVPNTRF
jgi:hypothetical protein